MAKTVVTTVATRAAHSTRRARAVLAPGRPKAEDESGPADEDEHRPEGQKSDGPEHDAEGAATGTGGQEFGRFGGVGGPPSAPPAPIWRLKVPCTGWEPAEMTRQVTT
jgi:hypothetical protein